MKHVWVFAMLAMSGMGLAHAAGQNDPTGTQGLLVIDKMGGKIDFFDPVTHVLLQSYDVDKNPHELAISPDHKTGYVTIYGPGIYGANPHPNHKIAVLDLVTHKITGMIDVSPYYAPHGIMLGPDGTLYVTSDVLRKLLVIDPKTLKVKDAIDTDGTGHFFALLPDASKAYISSKTDKDYVAVIDIASKKEVGRIPSPGGTEGITVSPDGRHVIVAMHSEPTLLVIDTKTDKIIDRVPMQGYPIVSPKKDHLIRPRFTPDGKMLLTSYYASGVVTLMDARNLHKQKMLVVEKGPMGFAFSADGKTALVSNHDYSTISVIDLKAGRVTGDFDAGLGVETLSFY